MIIIDYSKKHHKKIIQACVLALKQGRVVAYPTDTSYGLAVDAFNKKAVSKLYKIKGREFNKAVSVVIPSVVYGKKIVEFDKVANKIAKKFFPGAVTLVLPISDEKSSPLYKISAGSGYLGIRMPKNQVALDLAKSLGSAITATSANVSGQADCYTANEIAEQYKTKLNKPDIIINFGKLPKIRPSTILKLANGKVGIIRHGPVSKKEITKIVPLHFTS